MSAHGGSARNLMKNVLLVTLAVLLVVLAAANWIVGLNFRQMPADNLLRRAYDRIMGGAAGYELRSSGAAAAEPSQIALTVEGRLYGVQYSLTEIDAGLKATSALWPEVLSGETLEPTEESELITALTHSSCAMLRYHGAAPLSVAAVWLGGSSDSDLAAETLIYADGPGRLFVRTQDGSLYSAAAHAEEKTMKEAQTAFRGLPCEFAGATRKVYPETLIFESENFKLPALTALPPELFDPQSGAGLESLLGAFGYSPYARTYSEQGGQVRVYVSDLSTLRVSASGLVQYVTSGFEGTVKAYDEGEAAGSKALEAQLDCAKLVLDTALRAGDTDTHASLYAVQRDERSTTLVFLQMYGGVPIIGTEDFAVFRFIGGTLISAVIRLSRFQPLEEQYLIMPARQAAAGADGSMRELIAAYRNENGKYIPGRFFIKQHH